MKRSEIVAAMRQAQSEAEAGLYGESEEVAAYQRHLAAKVERTLGQIEPEVDTPELRRLRPSRSGMLSRLLWRIPR